MTHEAAGRTGRVIANFGRRVAVRPDGSDDIIAAHPLSRIPLLVAGDRVAVEPAELDRTQDDPDTTQWRVTTLLPRETLLERADRRGKAKPLAANLTHLAIVSAVEPGIDRLLIDQFCVGARLAGVEPLIVVNKVDLLSDVERREVMGWLTTYRAAGYETAMIDTLAREGIEPLVAQLAGRTIVLVGASGVGKSSIVERLLPDRDIRIGALSAATGIGRHTTTVTCWYELDARAALIDSPGVRRFAVMADDRAAVQRGFPDIAAVAEHCRFANCAHLKEPDCAVRAAIATGAIPAWRHENYRRLLEALP